MEEIKLNLENLTEEERAQLMFLVKKANKEEKKSNLWKPSHGEDYYYIEWDGDVARDEWDGGSYDEDAYAIGNCFETKKEAEFEVERRKVIVELKRFAEENGVSAESIRYYISGAFYDYGDSFIIGTSTTQSSLGCSIPVFSSSKVAEDAIKKIGEDRLKKYYFGVE